MKIENKHTLLRALQDGVNVFLGSGFSVLASDVNGMPLPTGVKLAGELIAKFHLDYAQELTLAQISTIVQNERRDEFIDYLVNRFTVSEFDVRYRNLNNVYIRTIFTTNIDNLLYKIFEDSINQYINDIDITGPSPHDKRAIDLVNLHGSVFHSGRPFKFGIFDISTAFRDDPDKWYLVTRRIQEHPTIFWGYGLGDSGTLEAISPDTAHSRPHKDKWIVVQQSENVGEINYFQALGFQIITATTSELLDFLGTLKEPKIFSRERIGVSTKELFPYEALPAITEVPSRPIIDFYSGAPPSWADIYAGRLHSTAHCASIRDSINSGRHTIVVGMAICGKTTLMMQVATQQKYDGHILACSSPTRARAEFIMRTLGHSNALIFIDNFTDDIDTFQFLIEQPNILTIGFDRDYNFDIVAHRVDLQKCNIVEVTGLSDHDLNEILSRIPPNLKMPYIQMPAVAPGVRPSLFELIEDNINRPKLSQRFRSVLEELEQKEMLLLEILIASCYVLRCRTVMSMDMLISYLRGIEDNYRNIYKMCEILGSMLAEYYGPLAYEDQDYWVPRSTIMANTVLREVKPEHLRRVFLRFHSNISLSRIPRNDIFTRWAYDATLLTRVFPDWNEGKSFYEKVCLRDPSPYRRQQGALYLSHNRRYKDAFAWIDEAVVQSSGKIWSILNSYAVILFRANIRHKSSDPVVQDTLKKSMDILSKCYEDDKRKTYHALTFADQAVRYYKIFQNEAGLRYLETAKAWLQEERQRVPWNRHIINLSEDIRRVMQGS